MATSVVSVLPRSSIFETSSEAYGKSRLLSACLIAILALIAVAIEGYHPYAEDGGLYAAGVQRLLDPALFPHWSAFVLAPMRISTFAPALAWLVRLTHLSLPVVLLLVQISTVFTTLLTAYCIAAECWQSRRARMGAVVVLACWLGLPVAGTSLQIIDPYVTARSFSTPCALLGLLAMLRLTADEPRRSRSLWLVLCAASLAFGSAMHPLMAGYGVAAACILACLRSPTRIVQSAGTMSCSVAAFLVAPALQHLAPPESHAYLAAALTRTYWFPREWSWYELAGLAAPLVLLALYASLRSSSPLHAYDGRSPTPSAAKALAAMAVVLGGTAILVAALYARPDAPTHLVARLQPLRVFQIVYMVMLLILGALLGEHVLGRGVVRWIAAVLLLGGPVFLAERMAFPSSDHVEIFDLSEANLWVQSFDWVRSHTPKDALFALEPDYIHAPGEDGQCFRAIAQRSVLPDYSKDGGEASIAPQLADLWQAGLRAQQGLSPHIHLDKTSQNTSGLRALGVSWVILRASASTNFPCPYSNHAAKVCRIS